jgi:hypothetical protein
MNEQLIKIEFENLKKFLKKNLKSLEKRKKQERKKNKKFSSTF